jgi:hypothetical protein
VATRWPRRPRPDRPMPPAAEVATWVELHHAAVVAGDLAAVAAWKRDFKAWCVEHGVDTVDAIQAAAAPKILAVQRG